MNSKTLIQIIVLSVILLFSTVFPLSMVWWKYGEIAKIRNVTCEESGEKATPSLIKDTTKETQRVIVRNSIPCSTTLIVGVSALVYIMGYLSLLVCIHALCQKYKREEKRERIQTALEKLYPKLLSDDSNPKSHIELILGGFVSEKKENADKDIERKNACYQNLVNKLIAVYFDEKQE